MGAVWDGGGFWPSIHAPFLAFPAELQKREVGGRAGRDLSGLGLLACLSSGDGGLEPLLPTSQSTILLGACLQLGEGV